MKEPTCGEFDDISIDSEDEDFEHEYIEIKNQEFQCEFDTDENGSQFALLKDENSLLQTPSPKQNATSNDTMVNSAASNPRLPTTFIPRQSSVIMSEGSQFYNHDPDKDEGTSQEQFELSPEEEFDKLQNIKVAGFSFFGVRDYMNHNGGLQSVTSANQVRSSKMFSPNTMSPKQESNSLYKSNRSSNVRLSTGGNPIEKMDTPVFNQFLNINTPSDNSADPYDINSANVSKSSANIKFQEQIQP